MADNFLVYRMQHLRKVNSQRRALSQPTIIDVPVLTRGEVMYIGEGQMDGQPATCYRCPFYNYGRSCQFMGPNVEVKKFVYPKQATSDAKQIEYWPCCGMFIPGKPNYSAETFFEYQLPASSLGFGWINAPKPGQKIGGANCGGKNGGDDCDHFCTDGPGDKREYPTAFCRVLQEQVENGAVCAAWRDDDWVSADLGANILRELANG